jgi:hypothetical protein
MRNFDRETSNGKRETGNVNLIREIHFIDSLVLDTAYTMKHNDHGAVPAVFRRTPCPMPVAHMHLQTEGLSLFCRNII